MHRARERERADGGHGGGAGALVGLVVNPLAGHDVRRLTALARVVDVHERANLAARVLGGLAAAGVDRVRYAREPTGVVERAMAALRALGARAPAEVLPALPRQAADAAGTSAAAAAMRDAGAGCVVAIGGDGTVRAVADGWPGAALVVLPGGTNNTLASCVEPTLAGLAAGAYARDPGRHARHLHGRERLEVTGAGVRTGALVDVALVAGDWVGARAIWDPAQLLEAVVLRADASRTGLAGVAGMVAGPGAQAVHLSFGAPGREVPAPLAPGVVVPLSVREARPLAAGERVPMGGHGGVLALDGEREVVVRRGDLVQVGVRGAGPRLLDAGGVLGGIAADAEAGVPLGAAGSHRAGRGRDA